MCGTGEEGHTAESCRQEKPAPVRLERRDSSRGRVDAWSYEESSRSGGVAAAVVRCFRESGP